MVHGNCKPFRMWLRWEIAASAARIRGVGAGILYKAGFRIARPARETWTSSSDLPPLKATMM